MARKKVIEFKSNNPGWELMTVLQQDRERQIAAANRELDEFDRRIKDAYRTRPSRSGSLMDALGITRRRGVGPGRMPEVIPPQSAPRTERKRSAKRGK